MTQASNTSKWYSIRQRTALAAAALGALSAAEIFIYGDIGESWWNESVTAAQFVKDIAALDAQQLTIRINSIGGSVPDGIAIHNAIKRHKAATTTVIDGMALSIASLIALAGDTVEMADNATMMIHAPWTRVAGNSAELRETADVLDTWASAMAASYVAKSGQTTEAIMALLTDGKDHWYTAEEAKAGGFVDAITDALPVSASAARPVFSADRFRNVPAALAEALLHTPSAPAAPAAAGAPIAAAAATLPVAQATVNQELPMSGTNSAATAQGPATPDAAAITAAALATENQRRADIKARFAPVLAREGVAALMATCDGDSTCTVQAASDRLLAHLGSQATPIAGHITTVADEGDKRIAAMAQSVMARAGVSDGKGRVVMDSTNPFRGHKLLDIARASLQAGGFKTDGMDQRALVAAAFTQSTSDFPILLENVMHKTLQGAYAVAADTWTRFCKKGSVSDFRAHPRYRVGSMSNLEAKTELGEFRNKTIPDGEKASITIGTKGNIINISREAIINDDLGAFVGLAAALGRAAKRTVEADVYALLASNPVMLDGFNLFHASHNNLLAVGTAVSVESVDAVRMAMALQMDVSGNDYLDLRPSIWLGPLSIGSKAREVNAAEYNDESNKQQRKPNISRGLYSDIVDTPRLSGTAWYSFVAPEEAPVIEVAFLDGNDTPYLEMEQGFTVDGSRWKVRLDYAAGAVDFRGAYKNNGA